MATNYTYFGNTSLSVKILAGLCQINLVPSFVVTTKGKPAGRGLKVKPSLVAEFCLAHNIKFIEVSSLKSEEVLTELIQNKTECALLAAFGKILPQSVLNIYSKGIVNVHPSLLPKYRGPSPLQYALLNNDKVTGVSLIVLDEEIDHGPVIAQTEFNINETDEYSDLEDMAANLAINMLSEHFVKYQQGLVIPTTQNHERASFTKMISKNMGQADYNLSAQVLHCQQRAFNVWPGLWTVWQGQIIKLTKTEVCPGVLPMGQIAMLENQVVVGTAQDLLVIKQLQIAGKKNTPVADFIRGHQSFIGSKLGL